MTVGKRRIGHRMPAYLVAEIGVSARGPGEAHDLIEQCAVAGYDAVKFQWHRPDEAVWDLIPEGAARAAGRAMRWFPDHARALAGMARELGLGVGITAFDALGIRELRDDIRFRWDFVKLGGCCADCAPLLEEAARAADEWDVPLVISSSGTTASALLRRIAPFRPLPMVLLACESRYPGGYAHEDALVALSVDGDVVGVSDHAPGRDALSGQHAIRQGASWVERHVAPDRDAPDGEVAVIGEDIAGWARAARKAKRGTRDASWWARPGWWHAQPGREGSRLTSGCVMRRPSIGVSGSHAIYGHVLRRDVEAGQPVRWQDLARRA